MNENETFCFKPTFSCYESVGTEKKQFENVVAVHMTPDLFFYRWFENQNDITPMQ